MLKSYKKHAVLTSAKYFVSDAFQASKVKLFVTLFLMFVSLVTGIILAIKFAGGTFVNLLKDYGIVKFVGSGITTSCLTRVLSITLVMLVLFGCSYFSWLAPFAVLLLCYRSYLLGFNICLLFISYSLSGIIISFFIIFPCQLAIMVALAIYFFMLRKCSRDCKFYGGRVGRDKLKISLIFFVILFLICLVETLLLLLFNANIIIVI